MSSRHTSRRQPTVGAFRELLKSVRVGEDALDAMARQVSRRTRDRARAASAMTHLDSSLLIDLLREHTRERPGPAFDVMESLGDDETLAVSVHVVCELRAGAELARRPAREHEALNQLLSGLVVAYPDARFAPAYGKLLASIERAGNRVAAMDLLIATAAILDDAQLVTRNAKDFERVPGLRVLRY